MSKKRGDYAPFQAALLTLYRGLESQRDRPDFLSTFLGSSKLFIDLRELTDADIHEAQAWGDDMRRAGLTQLPFETSTVIMGPIENDEGEAGYASVIFAQDGEMVAAISAIAYDNGACNGLPFVLGLGTDPTNAVLCDQRQPPDHPEQAEPFVNNATAIFSLLLGSLRMGAAKVAYDLPVSYGRAPTNTTPVPRFSFHVIEIDPTKVNRQNRPTQQVGPRRESPRLHKRRAFYRRVPGKGFVEVKECLVGDPRKGAVFSDYVIGKPRLEGRHA